MSAVDHLAIDVVPSAARIEDDVALLVFCSPLMQHVAAVVWKRQPEKTPTLQHPVYFIDDGWELARIDMLEDVFGLIDVNTVIREGNRLCHIMPNVPEIRPGKG
jgi:hypothetical protein